MNKSKSRGKLLTLLLLAILCLPLKTIIGQTPAGGQTGRGVDLKYMDTQAETDF